MVSFEKLYRNYSADIGAGGKCTVNIYSYHRSGIIFGDKQNIMICEWALDKGYLSYGGLVTLKTTEILHNMRLVTHVYYFTEDGSNLCCILNL